MSAIGGGADRRSVVWPRNVASGYLDAAGFAARIRNGKILGNDDGHSSAHVGRPLRRIEPVQPGALLARGRVEDRRVHAVRDDRHAIRIGAAVNEFSARPVGWGQDHDAAIVQSIWNAIVLVVSHWPPPKGLFADTNDVAGVFRKIYDDRVWGGGSGGSDPNLARPYLNFLQNS